MAFRGHFEVTLSISTSNFMCDACVMHTCTGLVGPKRGKVQKRLVFKAFLKGSKEPRVIQNPVAIERAGPIWRHFAATFGILISLRDSRRGTSRLRGFEASRLRGDLFSMDFRRFSKIFHRIHGIPLNSWNSIEFMEIRRNSLNSIEFLEFH